ncbi:MAG TPA: tetratricopeptide repeat protein, partial [Candidatus Hypogeohydataceae bacterium YC38]
FFMGRLLLSKGEVGPPLSGRNYAGPRERDASIGNLLPLFAALFFVANPVQTHGVTYITQRHGEMATLFYLLSLILFIRAVSGKRLRAYPYLGSLLSLLCGLWCREEVYTAPVMFFLYYLVFVAEDWRWPSLSRGLKLLLPHVALAGLSFYLGVMTAWGWTFEPNWRWGKGEYLLTQASVIVEYIQLLVLPLPRWLNADVDFPVSRGLWEGYTLFSLGVITLLLGTSIILLFKRGLSKEGKLLAFGVLWFFITLSPTSTVITLQEIMVVYRLYLPSIGFCLVWGICIHRAIGYLWSKGELGTRGALRAEVLVFSTILLCYSVGAYEHNKVWKDEITFWEDTVKKSPMKARAHYNLGVAYQAKGLLEKAVKEYLWCVRDGASRPEEKVRKERSYSRAWNNLGVICLEGGRDEEAMVNFKKALETQPENPDAHYNIGLYHLKRGDLEEAEKKFLAALTLNPFHAKGHYALGYLHSQKGLSDKAITSLEKALELDPAYEEAHRTLGLIWLNQKKDPKKALVHLQESLRLCKDPETLKTISATISDIKKWLED